MAPSFFFLKFWYRHHMDRYYILEKIGNSLTSRDFNPGKKRGQVFHYYFYFNDRLVNVSD